MRSSVSVTKISPVGTTHFLLVYTATIAMTSFVIAAVNTQATNYIARAPQPMYIDYVRVSQAI